MSKRVSYKQVHAVEQLCRDFAWELGEGHSEFVSAMEVIGRTKQTLPERLLAKAMRYLAKAQLSSHASAIVKLGEAVSLAGRMALEESEEK